VLAHRTFNESALSLSVHATLDDAESVIFDLCEGMSDRGERLCLANVNHSLTDAVFEAQAKRHHCLSLIDAYSNLVAAWCAGAYFGKHIIQDFQSLFRLCDHSVTHVCSWTVAII